MKYHLFIVGIIVLVAVFGLFSFWPSLIGAHYDGSVSCPLISMGDSSSCQNMNGHMNNLITHISDFSSMINAVLIGGIFSLLVIICAIKLFKKIRSARTDKFCVRKKKISQFIKYRDRLNLSIKLVYLLFFGFRRGILNTKVF